MIRYDRFWTLLKERGITQYDLYTHLGINRYTIHRLKHNKNMETDTLNYICQILHCKLEDIVEYTEDDIDEPTPL